MGQEIKTMEIKTKKEEVVSAPEVETKKDEKILPTEMLWRESNYTLPLSIIIVGAMLSGAIIYSVQLKARGVNMEPSQTKVSVLEKKVLPIKGVILPVKMGMIGSELVKSGSIDDKRFKALYEDRGQFTAEYEQLLFGNNTKNLKITHDNAGYLLNMFWALGLANANPILEEEMMDPRYGGAGNFASTGGWTMAMGNLMDHYNKHTFFTLTPNQQILVDKVSRGIYRPCCSNSVHFPDCNHGMAMLGLLELMAFQGVSEQEMWDTALVVNSYWFPDTYLTIATYMKNKGVEWQDVNSKEILGMEYSSARGFANISSQVTTPVNSQNDGGCGIDTGTPVSVSVPKQQSGCGV